MDRAAPVNWLNRLATTSFRSDYWSLLHVYALHFSPCLVLLCVFVPSCHGGWSLYMLCFLFPSVCSRMRYALLLSSSIDFSS